MKTIYAADLFCGAGGSSTGLYKAGDDLGLSVNLMAVNHWPVAIATHSANHKEALHLCHGLDGVDPRKIIPGGYLDLLIASPECTHHSNARGGKPMSDQSRASAWHIVRWAEALNVKNILVENVREFLNWGPLGHDGRPLKSRKGETFQAWLQALRSLGYVVDWKILNAADYGDPTTRQRLFVMAKKGRSQPVWPRPTHSKEGGKNLIGETQKWNAARGIIDWTDQGTSIFNRKKPLSPNTIRRIAAGLRKFSGIDLEPFLVKLYGTSDAASVEKPCPTVTGGGGHLAVAEPFLIPFFGERDGQEPRTHSVDEPAPAVTSHGAGAIVEPFLTEYHGDNKGKERVRSTEDPIPTLDCSNRFGLAQPYMISAGGPECGPRSTEDPAHTVLTRDHIAVVQPFIVGNGGPSGSGKPQSVDRPAGTVLGQNHKALIEPCLISVAHGIKKGESQDRRAKSVDTPLGTVTGSREVGVAQAFLVQYNGTADAKSIEQPIGTLTGKPRYALLITYESGERCLLDIRFRMLKPRELARAQSFPDDYHFTGKTEDVVKQIGNAVPVKMSQALCMSILKQKESR